MSRVRWIGLLAAASVAIASAFASSGLGQTVRVGNLEISIEGAVSPRKLPANAPAPIALELNGAIRTVDGAHPPALKTLTLRFDRHGHLDTRGLPTCTVGQVQDTLTARAKSVCGDALVGTGSASADIALPEQRPFGASGPLLIFNGKPKGGKTVLILHVHAHVPAPTTFVTTAVIERSRGTYGTTALVRIPTIVSGQGSLTGFRARIRRTWSLRGERKSLLLASCPGGSLRAQGTFDFVTGETVAGSVTTSCTTERAR